MLKHRADKSVHQYVLKEKEQEFGWADEKALEDRGEFGGFIKAPGERYEKGPTEGENESEVEAMPHD